MEYSGLFSRGWSTIWRNKWMWLLAFIPAVGGLLTFGFNIAQQGAALGSGEGTSYYSGTLVLLSCLQLIVSLLFALIGLAARGGLITAVDGIDRGESYTFGRAFGDGRHKIWSLVGMSLLLFGGFIVLVIGMALIAMIPALIGALAERSGQNQVLAGGMGHLWTLGLCCLVVFFVPAAVMLNLIYPFAYRGIMLRDMGVRESIRHGWKVARGNLGEIVLLALPFFLLSVLLAGIYSAVALGGSLTAMRSGDPAAAMNTFSWNFIVLYVSWSLIYTVLLAWQSATFTLGYRVWTGKGTLGDEESLWAEWRP